MNFHKIAIRIAQVELVDNPFPSSVIQNPVYHGTHGKFTRFQRPPQGVWFSGTPEWVDDKYASCSKCKGTGSIGSTDCDKCGGTGSFEEGVLTCYIDVRNPYEPTDDEFDEYYDFYDNPTRLKSIQDFFANLKARGFDAYVQGGESESIAVFDTVHIVNATTGNPM